MALSRRHAAVAMAVTLAVTALLAATPSAAVPSDHAYRVVLRDGPGDVWKFESRTEKSTRLTRFPLADVTRVVVTHGTGALGVRMRFVDIRKVGVQLYWLEIGTPQHHFQAVLISRPGNRQGSRYFQGDDGSRSCRGFTRAIDYAGNVVSMRIPRTCLRNPAWVKLGIFNQLNLGDSKASYFDTPLTHGSAPQGNDETVRLYEKPA